MILQFYFTFNDISGGKSAVVLMLTYSTQLNLSEVQLCQSYLKNYKRAQWELCSLRFIHHHFHKHGKSSPEDVEGKKYPSKKTLCLTSRSRGLFSPLFYPNRKSSWWRGVSWPSIIHTMSWTVGQLLGEKEKVHYRRKLCFCFVEVSPSAPVKVSSDI